MKPCPRVSGTGAIRRPGTILRERGRAHQVAVALTGGRAAFVDRPDDEALAAAAVAGGEDAGKIGRVDVVVGLDVAAGVGVEGKRLDERLFGSEPMLPVRFLGATAYFPVNPMRLAAILRRRVVFMLGLYRGANRYHVLFEPLADFTEVSVAQRPAAIETAVQRYAQLLERRCRSDPYNWFNFFEFWPDRPPEPLAAGSPITGHGP